MNTLLFLLTSQYASEVKAHRVISPLKVRKSPIGLNAAKRTGCFKTVVLFYM